jgi:hypothetical protein
MATAAATFPGGEILEIELDFELTLGEVVDGIR